MTIAQQSLVILAPLKQSNLSLKQEILNKYLGSLFI